MEPAEPPLHGVVSPEGDSPAAVHERPDPEGGRSTEHRTGLRHLGELLTFRPEMPGTELQERRGGSGDQGDGGRRRSAPPGQPLPEPSGVLPRRNKHQHSGDPSLRPWILVEALGQALPAPLGAVGRHLSFETLCRGLLCLLILAHTVDAIPCKGSGHPPQD